ncbi:MAG: peptidoglycan DD-metalloendopeptidase family protein [Dethiobacteria bacterium]|jgi:murein DD-endopeptidase MepM/ murein hydrolase activator NlpD
MALLKIIGGILKRTFRKQKSSLVESETGGDRLETPEKNTTLSRLRGSFSWRYLILAGSYLVIVAVLLSFIVIKWKIPPLELPGLPEAEKETRYQFQEGEKLQEASPDVPGKAANTGNEGINAANSVKDEKVTDDINLVPVVGENEKALPASEGNMTAFPEAAEVVLPQAADPLPQWYLQCPFNSYLVEKLPSGDNLHRLSRGVLLRTTSAAPVSVLWAGKVVSAGDSGSPHGLSVLVEHEGGYRTFYGNLSEIWVEEGSSLKEGENIGLLSHTPPLEEGLSVAGRPPGEAWELPMRSVWRGYYDEETETFLPVIQADQDCVNEVTDFYKEDPLLYLEVHLGHKFLDPLEFILDRN